MFKYEINGITKQLGAIRTGHSDYLMDSFVSNNLQFNITKIGGHKVVKHANVKSSIVKALSYIDKKCAAKKSCNSYFLKLNSKSPISLRQILDKKTLHIYRLRPLGKNTVLTIPAGFCFSWGANWAQIGINELELTDFMETAHTLLHELAHVAGAPGRRVAPKSLAAERSALYCGLRRLFDPKAYGSLEVIPSSGEGQTALA